jgi:hypothetical protein
MNGRDIDIDIDIDLWKNMKQLDSRSY